MTNIFKPFKTNFRAVKCKYPNIAQLAERPTVESRIRKVVIGRSLVRIRVFGVFFLFLQINQTLIPIKLINLLTSYDQAINQNCNQSRVLKVRILVKKQENLNILFICLVLVFH